MEIYEEKVKQARDRVHHYFVIKKEDPMKATILYGKILKEDVILLLELADIWLSTSQAEGELPEKEIKDLEEVLEASAKDYPYYKLWGVIDNQDFHTALKAVLKYIDLCRIPFMKVKEENERLKREIDNWIGEEEEFQINDMRLTELRAENQQLKARVEELEKVLKKNREK